MAGSRNLRIRMALRADSRKLEGPNDASAEDNFVISIVVAGWFVYTASLVCPAFYNLRSQETRAVLSCGAALNEKTPTEHLLLVPIPFSMWFLSMKCLLRSALQIFSTCLMHTFRRSSLRSPIDGLMFSPSSRML